MSKRMTVVLHDEDLYTDLKVGAARLHRTASEIVAEAIREWLESREDAMQLPVVASARAEWREKTGRLWSEVESEWEVHLANRERAAKPKRASA